MTDNCQVPWTDEQWARVNGVIQEEAGRARVAATFLPLVGPLPADTDFVREEHVQNQDPLTIEDRTTIRLDTLQVEVAVRGSQMSDSDLTSALDLFRRAANGLARLEDAVVFNGIGMVAGGGRAGGVGLAPPRGIPGLLGVWRIPSGELAQGLWDVGQNQRVALGADTGQELVRSVSAAIGQLEDGGHFGPFALVLDRRFFETAQRPDAGSLVLPQDRIIPFLGGGSLLRCSALPDYSGVIVALGGAPVELVVATDMSLQFLQMTLEPAFVFRVYERIVLRIKEPDAICALGL